MFSEAVTDYLDVLTLYLPGGTEENNLRQGSNYMVWDMNSGPPNEKQEWTKINNHNLEVNVIHIHWSWDRLTAPQGKGFAGTKT